MAEIDSLTDGRSNLGAKLKSTNIDGVGGIIPPGDCHTLLELSHELDRVWLLGTVLGIGLGGATLGGVYGAFPGIDDSDAWSILDGPEGDIADDGSDGDEDDDSIWLVGVDMDLFGDGWIGDGGSCLGDDSIATFCSSSCVWSLSSSSKDWIGLLGSSPEINSYIDWYKTT